MLIAQITDSHIGPRQISMGNEERLSRVVERIKSFQPDLILATGDLTEDGDLASFERFRELTASLPAPLLPLAGNHDDRESLLTVFPGRQDSDGFVQYVHDQAGRRVIVIDSVEAGRHGGSLCERRLSWLCARLDEAPTRPTLIALHHPPLRSGIAWMDVGADGPWSEALAEALAGRSQVAGLVCGHLHRPTTGRLGQHPLIVSPSTAPGLALDLRPASPDAPDGRPLILDEPPGLTLHQWDEDGLVSHFVAVGEAPVLARFDETLKGTVQSIMKPAPPSRIAVPIRAAAPTASAASPFPSDVHNMLVTAQQAHVNLSAMADSKASFLLAINGLCFGWAIDQAAEGLPTMPVMTLALFSLIASLLAVMAIRPMLIKPPAEVGPNTNVLFFGGFSGISEDAYLDHIVEKMRSKEDVFRLMARDLYQNGRVLQKRKYFYLYFAYRAMLLGFVATAAVFVIEHAARWMDYLPW